MNQKNYPCAGALMCLLMLLLCFSVTQAQERLWGVSSSGALFSMNRDGSDYQSVNAFSDALYGYDVGGLLPLSNGEVMITTTASTADGYGAYNKITAQGLSQLYFVDYMQGDASRGLVQGDNGKVYTGLNSVLYNKLTGIVEMEPDGSDFNSFHISTIDQSEEYALTKGETGIYGLSRGDPNNNGFIFKLRADYHGIQVVYQFTGSEGGFRPTGRLMKGDNGFLFGTTLRGGLNNKGMFFKIKEDGTQLTKLFDLASKSITKPEANGQYQTLLDLLAEGYRPLTDSEGYYYIHDGTGIYKINPAGFQVSRISTVAADKIVLITPSFQHAVKVSNIADQSTGLSTDLSVQAHAFPGATGYDLQVSTISDFSTILMELSNNQPLFALNDLDESTTYYVRARPNIWPYYGETVSFTTRNPVDLTEQTILGFGYHDFYLDKEGDRPPFSLSVKNTIGLFGGAVQLSTGDILMVTESEQGAGEISKVTPSGLVTVYTLLDALDYSYLDEIMVEGADGYVYSLRFNVIGLEFAGFIRYKPDGSSYESSEVMHAEILQERNTISATTQGIYGITRGFTGTKGFLYKVRSDISDLDVLYYFQDATGARPQGKVVEGSDGFLYGTASLGGAFGAGVIYKIGMDGTQYTVLHHFSNANGNYPVTGLVTDGSGTLYGTTRLGGRNGKGVIFKINEDGTGFQKLLNFYDVGAINLASGGKVAEIKLGNDGYLYGVANIGAYRIKTDGTGFQKLHPDASSLDLIHQPFVPEVAVVSPANQSSNVSLNPIVSVTPVTGAATYSLELSKTANFSDSITTLTSEEPVFNVSGLEHFTTYFARVRSSLLPYYGETTSFTTQDEVSYVISPEDGETGVGVDPAPGVVRLDVTVKALPGATYYTVQVSQDPDFAGGPEIELSNWEGQTTLEFSWLFQYGTLYYARVKTNLSPDWGPVTSFQTLEDLAMNANVMESAVFPNPSASAFTLRSGTEEIRSISITDTNGMVVYQNDSVENDAAFQFGEELKKGIYILKIKGTAGEKVLRLIKQ
jgi:uncharacterized repeat protein (TIGR03803 family)